MILDRLLAKDPNDRFATPAEVAEALAPWCAGADLPALLQRAIEAEQRSLRRWLKICDCPSPQGTPESAVKPPLLLTSWGWKWFIGQLILLMLAGSLGFCLGILIRIHKDGRDTTVEIPLGSHATVDGEGNVALDVPGRSEAVKPSAVNAAATPQGSKVSLGGLGPLSSPPAVTVARLVVREIIDYEDFVGTTEAAQTVEIRARVTGTLKQVLFKGGATVKRNDLLFEIDPTSFQADVDKHEAEIRLAQLPGNASPPIGRHENAPSKDRSRIESELAEADAALKAAEEGLRVAKLHLCSTKLNAPIDGLISRPLVTQGTSCRLKPCRWPRSVRSIQCACRLTSTSGRSWDFAAELCEGRWQVGALRPFCTV